MITPGAENDFCFPNGTACDDGNAATVNDQFDNNCNCAGIIGTSLAFKAALEGYMQTDGTMTNEINNLGLLPSQPPFDLDPWNYNGTESNSNMPANAVDWVIINAYDTNENILDTKVGLILKNGEVFTTENITVKRPGDGISPMLWDKILGQVAKRDFTKDELISL